MKQFLNTIAAICFGGVALAGPLEGERTVKLLNGDGAALTVATVTFSPDGDAATYGFTLNDAAFTDHFLSMRPFKCLESPDKHWCYVPYPYENKRTVRPDDLADLEYDLLFVWKGASEYGINLWNGVYYKLEVDGDRLVGQLYEMDMERLGVPPDAGNLRPIQAKHLDAGDPDSHWLPKVVIE